MEKIQLKNTLKKPSSKTDKEKRHKLPMTGVERDITTDPANIKRRIKECNKTVLINSIK